jgi:hypothetical protein
MQRIPIFLILLGLTVSTLCAGAFLDFFKGKSDGNNVTLEWRTRDENNVGTFEIQRRAGNSGDFAVLATVDPQGANSSYTYVDRSAYKSSANMYVYRLRIIDRGSDQSAYSNEITIYHSATSVKRTWGSIKAMFR